MEPIRNKKDLKVVGMKENVKRVLHRYHDRQKNEILELRVVSWLVEGRETLPQLQKIKKYVDSEGFERVAKIKGITPNDFEIICQRLDEIKDLMESKPEQPALAAAPPPTPIPEPPAPPYTYPKPSDEEYKTLFDWRNDPSIRDH